MSAFCVKDEEKSISSDKEKASKFNWNLAWVGKLDGRTEPQPGAIGEIAGTLRGSFHEQIVQPNLKTCPKLVPS